jgi:hypothetical protein
MTRRLKAIGIVCAVLALILLALLPPGTRQTAPPPSTTVRGAFHIHSERSDGSGSVDAIAEAAARAGLHFIILTDHGDATRAPDPPAYRSGVLVIDGVELNTSGGHYAVIDLPSAPYPLAGTPDEVIEDVTRLGGFGFAAHPGSPRPSLSWQAWDARIDGLEWINADSEWRDEPRIPIARALLTYLFRAPQSMATLLDRPSAVFERWDALARTRRIVGLAGADAHARLGFSQRTDPDYSAIHVPVPGYESSFRAFSNHVVLDAPLAGDAATDARRVSAAIRDGRVYSVIDALASPGALTFTAASGSGSASMGGTLPIEGDVLLRATINAPPGTALVLLRDGQRVHEVIDGPLETNGGKEPAVYRIEAYTANAPGGPTVPWIVSNPIYAGLSHQAVTAPAVPEPTSRIPARTAEAAGEFGPNDTSTVVAAPLDDSRARTFAGDPAIGWTFALSPGTPVGQFAAVAIPVTGGLADYDRIRFMVSSSAPMRVWVQLRAPVGNTERWGATFYTGREPGLVDIPFPKFRAIGVTSSPLAPLDRVSHILFVVDTLNTLPGTKGSLTISEVGLVK